MWYRNLPAKVLGSYKDKTSFLYRKAQYALLFNVVLLCLLLAYLIIRVTHQGFDPGLVIHLVTGILLLAGTSLLIMGGRLTMACTLLMAVSLVQLAVMFESEVARGYFTFAILCYLGFSVIAVKPWQEVFSAVAYPILVVSRGIKDVYLMGTGVLTRDVMDQSLFTILVGLALIPLMRLLVNIVRRDIHNMEALFRTNQKLLLLSRTDTLTGADNRRSLDTQLERELLRCDRYRTDLAMLYLDLDHFKALNDQHGHSAGDQALETLADTVRTCIRSTDLFFRWGGDEFIILSPLTNMEGMVALGRKVAEATLETPLFRRHGLGLSAGIVLYRHGESVQSFLKRADTLMYDAKALGGNRLCPQDAPPIPLDQHHENPL